MAEPLSDSEIRQELLRMVVDRKVREILGPAMKELKDGVLNRFAGPDRPRALKMALDAVADSASSYFEELIARVEKQ